MTGCAILLAVTLAISAPAPAAAGPDLGAASIVIGSKATAGDRLAASVLREEVRARTGLDWPVTTAWPAGGAVVAIAERATPAPRPDRPALDGAAGHKEGYRLVARVEDERPVVWIVGADRRGTLFGVGNLLRVLSWDRGSARLPHEADVSTSPRYPLRGHQLGYRHHSNTYDGWTPAQYEQYIRDLVLMGANAIENIPFQDPRPAPLMPVSRAAMNRAVSAICAKYDVQYWLWMPADFPLSDAARRAEALDRMDALFADSARLDAIFVPGGDPGDNPAQLVVPYLQDIATRLRKHHPRAAVWLSLQHFDRNEVDYLFSWIDRERPGWLGGLIAGPGSASLQQIRGRLGRRYQVRDYPDIAHTVRCQYPVRRWDPAFALTLGREPVNPRPVFYARVHDRTAAYTDGFISYSDGVNDDFNKALWTRKAWDPALDVRTIALEYTRTFFGAAVADRAADGLLALERNWEGPLAVNGAVDATLSLWQQLEADAPQLSSNWRWQMHVLRAYYDAYTRHRLIQETALERQAYDALGEAPGIGSAAAMDKATAVLERAATAGCCEDWRRRIEVLGDALFQSIRVQLSVPKYSASGYERGAVLDFLDQPLNNRWWLEDEFVKVKALPGELARLDRLDVLRRWSNPPAGSWYDDVGNIAASPHVSSSPDRSPGGGDEDEDDRVPHFTWEGGPTRKRLSWLTSLRWPGALAYESLDPAAQYEVRLNVITDTAPGQVKLRIDGHPAAPLAPAVRLGDLLRYAVPPDAVADGRLVLTFDSIDERRVNWRQYSRLVEAWLIRVADAPSSEGH